MPHSKGRFASKLADFNNDMNIIVPYLNDPANTNRLHVSTGTGGNLPILNTFYSNPNPRGVTAPDNLGWKELWILRSAKATKGGVVDLIQIRRLQLENILRTIYADIPNSALTPTDRTILNIPEHSTTHTDAPLPANAPAIAIVEQGNGFAILSITDPAHPHTQEKPKGVAHIELEGAFQSREEIVAANTQRTAQPGTTPAPVPAAFPQEADFHHIADAGTFLYKTHFTTDQDGGTEVIRGRYVNTRHQHGDWSVQVPVTVSAK